MSGVSVECGKLGCCVQRWYPIMELQLAACLPAQLPANLHESVGEDGPNTEAPATQV